MTLMLEVEKEWLSVILEQNYLVIFWKIWLKVLCLFVNLPLLLFNQKYEQMFYCIYLVLNALASLNLI
jgi:hypothetical protein